MKGGTAAWAAVPPQAVLPLGGRDIVVAWRRSPRARRVSLRVDPASGGVVVTLPSRSREASGLALLRANADWIARRIAALPSRIAFADGAAIPLAGEMMVVRHDPSGRGGAWIENGGTLVASGGAEFLARRIGDFLRAEARRRLTALAERIGASATLRPRRIAIKDTRTRWGSCTADGTVMFTWRLVMAPPEVQHYVVAHELAHLRHLDHGRAFWDLVETLTPHRKPAEEWLRANGTGLLRIG